MNEAANRTVRLTASLLFTRRIYQITVDALLPFRLAWTPAPDGFTVTLFALHEDGTTTPLVLYLVPIPCQLGGR